MTCLILWCSPVFVAKYRVHKKILWQCTGSQLDAVDLHKDTVFCVKVIFETCKIILHDATVHRRIISLSRFINFAFWRLSSFTMKVELVYVHYLNEKYGTSQPTEVDLASLRATVDLCWIHICIAGSRRTRDGIWCWLVPFFYSSFSSHIYFIKISNVFMDATWCNGTDSQKQLAGTSVVGDTSLHQPVGLPPAIHAASVMAGVLGGAQTAIVQNGLPVQYGLGNDPLTHYLARMSRHQLHEIMAELKVNL